MSENDLIFIVINLIVLDVIFVCLLVLCGVLICKGAKHLKTIKALSKMFGGGKDENGKH